MATTVGQHSVAAFTSPVNGTTPIDANTVRGNDNTVRVAYVDHDADPGIHVQSSTLASRPVAGTAGRKWITEDSGLYTLWFDDGTNWHPVSSEAVALSVLATETLAKGDVVKVTGWNNGQDLPEVAKTTSASDTAFAVITAAVASGAMGYATNTGVLQDINTNAYNVGDILYANGSGGFTATKPTSGNYQPCAYVMRKNTNNGVIYVEFSTPRIVERSDNTASTIVLRDASGNFSAGTITATAVNTTTIDLTNLEVTNIKAKDGTASATIADSTGVMTIGSSVLTTTDINGGTIDGVTIGGASAGVGTFTTLNATTVNTTTLDLTNLEVTNIKAKDGTAAATIADSTGKITVSTELAVDNLNLSGNAITSTDTNGNIDLTPNGTGEVNITKVDIDSGAIDGTTIGGSSAAAGTFTTVAGTTGNITTVNATTVDTTNIEVTNVKAKDGTASIAIADSTGVATISAAPVLSALTASQAVFTDASKGLVSNAITGTGNVVMSASPTLSGTITAANVSMSGTLTLGSDVALSRGAADRLDLATGDSLNVVSGTYKIAGTDVLSSNTLGSGVTASSLTSVGTLTSLTVSGDLTVDTSTLKVDSANNRTLMGITTARNVGYGDSGRLNIEGTSYSTAAIAVVNNSNNGDAPSLNFGKSRGTATGSYTAVQSGDGLGIIDFVGANGSAFNIAARIVAAVDGTVSGGGANDMPGRLEFYTTADGSGTPTERMRIDSAGNLGLGVTPSAWTRRAIQVGAAGSVSYFAATNIGVMSANSFYDGVDKYIGNNFATQYAQSGGAHLWFTAPSGTAGNAITFTQAMTLDASGNLGLGVTPSAWDTFTALQVKNASVTGYLNWAYFQANAYYQTAVGNKYIAADYATRYRQESGKHIWDTAPSGSANATITFTQAMTLDASGNLGVGTTSPGSRLHVVGGQDNARFASTTTNMFAGFYYNTSTLFGYIGNGSGLITGGASGDFAVRSEGALLFSAGGATERARITSGGSFLVGTTNEFPASNNVAGHSLVVGGIANHSADSDLALRVNRITNDGTLVEFRQDGTVEGTISVSGNTVSYNAFAGSHWSQLEDGSKPEILRGTVMEALNELCEWPDESNERLPKTKVSDTAGSKKVYGVFMDWDNDWTATNDMYVTAVGAFICRVAADVVVEQGNLLESNGDGTARVQADDVIRSSTIGKVTSTVKTHEYEDGTYCVPTVLYCG